MKKTIALLLAMAMTLTLCAPSGLSTARAADLSAQAVAEQSDLSAEASAEELSALEQDDPEASAEELPAPEQDESDPAPEVEVEQPEAVAEEEQPSAEPEEESQPEPAPEEEVELDEPTAVAEVEAEDEDESPEIAVQADSDFTIDSNGVLTKYNGAGGAVVIPDGVKKISAKAFASNTKITSVTIPDSVTNITGGNSYNVDGSGGFRNCTALQSVSIGNGLTYIPQDTFSGCKSLTSVTIGSSVTRIDADAFLNCTALKNVSIPSNVTTIGKLAFYGTGLTSISVPNTVKSLGSYVFGECASLTSVTLEEGLTGVTDGMFNKCTALKSVIIPSTVTSIGNAAFSGCTGLTCVIVQNDTTSIVYNSAAYPPYNDSFKSCSNITFYGYSDNSTAKEYAEKYDTFTYKTLLTTSNGVITKCNYDSVTNLVIPEKINGVTVTGIADNAFSDCKSLISMTLPSGVKSIGASAFQGCSGLTSVSIPSSVTSIGNYAFSGCSKLESATLPSSVTSIGKSAFYSCSALESVTIPSGVTSIGEYTFASTGLTSVSIPSSVKSISEVAFYNCTNLSSVELSCGVSVEIKSTLEKQVGSNKVNQKAHTWGNWSNSQRKCSTCGKTETCSHASWNAWNTSGTTSQRTCKTCGKEQTCSHASWNAWNTSGTTSQRTCSTCGKVETCSHNWGSWNSTTSQRTCSTCGKVETCTNHNWGTGWNSTTSQRTCSTCGAEETCTEHTWGSNGDGVNKKCNTCGKTETCNHDSWGNWSGTTSQRTCSTCGKVETCTDHDWGNWSNSQRTCNTCRKVETCSNHTWGKLNNGVSRCETCQMMCPIDVVGTQLIKYTGTATVLVLPSGITSIGDKAFAGCTGLTSVSIPSSVTSIGEEAFFGCTKLTSVSIPSSVTSIGNYAFYGCTELTSVTIPEGVTSIGNSAFYGCTELTSVSIPSSVTSIENSAFFGCKKLTSVSIPSSVTSIGEYAFDFSSSVELSCGASDAIKSTLKNQVGSNKVNQKAHTWGDWSDSQRTCSTCGKTETCTNHTWEDKGNNHTCKTCQLSGAHKWGKLNDRVSRCETCQLMCPINVVDTQLMRYNGTATVLVLPSGITSIGDEAFSGCTGLTSVTIPSGVTSIGKSAFNSCINLSSVTIPSGVTSIGDDAFASCTNLSSVSIPSSVKSIENSAFFGCKKLTSVSIPSSVKSIGNSAFAFSGLTSVSIPSGVTSIGEGAFSCCSNLSSVELSCGVSAAIKSTLENQVDDKDQVNQNAHTWGNWSDSQRTCSTCGKVETCTNHNWSVWSNSKRTCSTCGAEETCSHTWGVWENPDKNSSRRHTCSTCGKEEFCGHSKPEHKDYWSKTSEGHTCTNCGLIGEHDFLRLPEPNELMCGICRWEGMCYHKNWDAETKCTRCKVQGYTVTVNSKNNDTALQGGGIYAENTKATVIAPAKAGFTFKGWYNGETQVCNTLEYTFTVTEQTSLTTTLTAKYEDNQKFAVTILGENGAQFTVGDSTTVQPSITNEMYAFGTKLVLKAVDADKVSAWLNGSDKKLGSGATLEVTVTGAMTIKLMYKAEADGQAMVEYVSDYGQILSCTSYRATDNIVEPTGPSKTGYIFSGWSLTVEQIKAKITEGEKHIVVTPVYQAVETKYTVKVNYVTVNCPDDTESETFENIREGTAKTITAKDIKGKTFAYWRDEYNKILSYSKSYYLVMMENVTLTAVYKTVISEDEPQAKPLIHMEKSKAFEEDGVAKLSFTTSYDVPAGYTLNEVGIIRSTSANTEDTLVIGGTGVKQHPSSLTTEKGVYTYVIRVGTHVDDTVYARGYVVVTNNATGNIETTYAELAWGSYNSFRGSTNG